MCDHTQCWQERGEGRQTSGLAGGSVNRSSLWDKTCKMGLCEPFDPEVTLPGAGLLDILAKMWQKNRYKDVHCRDVQTNPRSHVTTIEDGPDHWRPQPQAARGHLCGRGWNGLQDAELGKEAGEGGCLWKQKHGEAIS